MAADIRHSRLLRLLDGIGGQLYARGTLILFQIVAVPLLIAAWGVEHYGAWLALTAFAGIASNANFGMLNAFTVEINSLGAGDDARRLRDTVRTASLMLCLLLGPALLLMCAAGWFLPVAAWLKLSGIGRVEVFQILMFVAVQIWADNLRSISAAIIIARGRYGLPNFIAGTLRLVEIGGLAVLVLAFDGTIVDAAMVGTAVALLNLVLHRLAARAMAGPALRGERRFDGRLVRALLPASVGSFILSVGVNMVTVHGTRLAISAYLGPRAVAIYAVTMTAAKLIDQLNVSFVGVLQPEFSRLRGMEDAGDAGRLVAFGSQAALASFIVLAAGILLLGPAIFDLWTTGTIPFSYPLAGSLLVGILLMQAGKSALYYLTGINVVLALGIGALASSLLGLLAALLLMPQYGVYGAAAGFVLGEALLLATIVRCASRQLDLAPLELLRRLVSVGELPGVLAPIMRRALPR